LLTLVCFRGVCTGDDISGSADLTYRSTETNTDDEENESSWSFAQNYNLHATKDFTPKVNLAANLGININETNETTTTLLTPDIRLNIKNEYFYANTGYRITQKGLNILSGVSDEDRLTTESWNANFSTKSDKYPKVQLRYNEDLNYDHLAVRETDSKTTNFSGTADYTYRFLNFNYEYKNNVSDDYVTEFITETDTHYGRIDFRQSFWKNKIATSGSYSITNTKTETKTTEQGVKVAEKKSPSAGLYDNDPSNPLDIELTSNGSLIDGNKTASAGINIGEIQNQNIGIDLNYDTKVELIYLYTTTPNALFNNGLFTWAVYYSSDNSSWKEITSSANKNYDTMNNRFEISFAATTARYFKIVNTANDTYELYVTEIEAYNYKTYSTFSTSETEQTTQTTQANLRYKPTDWLSFTYDFTNDERKTEPDQEKTELESEKTKRLTHNMNCRVERELHKYITAWAQYGRRMEYDSEAEDKTTDTYLLHFLSSPLPTLDTDLSLNHTVSKEEGETQSKNSSALLHISAKLRKGADLNVDANITRSKNLVSQSETTTKSINSDLRLELTRMLTAEIEYDTNWTETQQSQQSEIDGETTGRTSSARVILYWRPSHDFYFRGSYDIDRDEKSGEETTRQQYNMNWLMTEKMQLDVGHTLNRDDTVSSTYSADLSWNLSRVFTLRFGYDWSHQKEDMAETTQTFITNLSARF